MFERKVHYKLRKRKKQWIVVGVSVMSGVLFAFSLDSSSAFAAEDTPTVSQTAGQTATSSVTADTVHNDTTPATSEATTSPVVDQPVAAENTTTTVAPVTTPSGSVAEPTPATATLADATMAANDQTINQTLPAEVSSTPADSATNVANPTATTTPVTADSTETSTTDVQSVVTEPVVTVTNETATTVPEQTPEATPATSENATSVQTEPATPVAETPTEPAKTVETPTPVESATPATPTSEPTASVNPTEPTAEISESVAPVTNEAQSDSAVQTGTEPVTQPQVNNDTADQSVPVASNSAPTMVLAATAPEAETAATDSQKTYSFDVEQVSTSGKVLNETTVSTTPTITGEDGQVVQQGQYDDEATAKYTDFVQNATKPISGYDLSQVLVTKDGDNSSVMLNSDWLANETVSNQAAAQDVANTISNTAVNFLTTSANDNYNQKYIYTPIEYNVNFDSKGGNSIATVPFNIETSIDKFIGPTRAGYDFTGWQDEQGNIVTTIPVGTIGDKTLTAQWTPQKRDITIHFVDASEMTDPETPPTDLKAPVTIKDQAVDSTIDVNAAVTDYDIPGYDKVTTGLNPSYVVSADDTQAFYVLYQAHPYTVTYNSNGGTAVDGRQYTIKDAFGLPTPTRDGYTFGGWQDGTNTISEIAKGTIGDKTLNAIWNPITYQATFDSAGGTPVANQDYTIEQGIENFTTPTRDGYTFSGWLDSNGNPANSIPTGQTGDRSFTAKWAPIAYQATFDSAGGTSVANQDYTIEKGIENFTTPTRDGYTFSGWVDSDGNPATSIPTGQTGDRSFTAKWTPIAYQVTFNSDGGNTISPIGFNVEQAVKDFPTPTKDGYSFEGWYDPDGNKVTEVSVGTMENVQLTAHWAKKADKPGGGGTTDPGKKPGGGTTDPGKKPGGGTTDPGKNPGGNTTDPGKNPGGGTTDPGKKTGGNTTNPGVTSHVNTITPGEISGGGITTDTNKNTGNAMNLVNPSSATKTSATQNGVEQEVIAGANELKKGTDLAENQVAMAKQLANQGTDATTTLANPAKSTEMMHQVVANNPMTSQDLAQGSMQEPTMMNSGQNQAANMTPTSNVSSTNEANAATTPTDQAQYPKTGEKENHLGILGAMLTAISGWFGLLIARKRKEEE